MSKFNKFIHSPQFRVLLVVVALLLLTVPAFADLEGGVTELQVKVKAICTPLAIIFLIIAGWQKAMGNSQLFLASVIGTIVMFAAPQLVEFISTAFGG